MKISVEFEIPDGQGEALLSVVRQIERRVMLAVRGVRTTRGGAQRLSVAAFARSINVSRARVDHALAGACVKKGAWIRDAWAEWQKRSDR